MMTDKPSHQEINQQHERDGAVTVRIADGVGTISLSRADALNAFNAAQRSTLLAALQSLSSDDEVGVIIITGEGRGFCAGADLREQGGYDKPPSARLLEEYAPFLEAVAALPKPVIAAVNGIAAGIGGALVLSCDLVVMAESASIYLAFSAIGLVPDGGLTWHLERQLGRRKAFEIMALGQRIEANACLQLGLANRVVADDAVMAEALSLASDLLVRAPLSLRFTKEAVHAATRSTLRDAIETEARLQDKAAASEDHKEGRQAFLEKRAPRWTGQ
ncbi:MAG: enoyl-CoA hydratase-related protein [Pseudomonadota bacterium]